MGEKELETMPTDFNHVTDLFTRNALAAEPSKLSPEAMEQLTRKTLEASRADLLDPDVLNALARSFIALQAALENDFSEGARVDL